METISHRELRNQSAEVLRRVAAGETFVVTNHGRVVAQISPPPPSPDLRCVRPATTRPTYSQARRVTPTTSSRDLLDDLRGDR